MPHPMLRLLALPLGLTLALGGCSPAPDAGTDGERRSGETAPAQTALPWDEAVGRVATTALPAGHLAPFEHCDALLTYYQANALQLVTPYGLGQGGGEVWTMADDASTGDGDAAGMAADSAAGAAPPEHSTTNVQEEGVDEADIVKTDGRVIVTVLSGTVRVVDVETEEVVATVTLPGRRDQVSPSEILLHGSTLVVLGQEWAQAGPVDDRVLAFPATRTVVTTVDLSDPAAPRTVGSVRMEGLAGDRAGLPAGVPVGGGRGRQLRGGAGAAGRRRPAHRG